MAETKALRKLTCICCHNVPLEFAPTIEYPVCLGCQKNCTTRNCSLPKPYQWFWLGTIIERIEATNV